MENKMSKKIRVQYTVHDKNRNIVLGITEKRFYKLTEAEG